MGCSQYCLIFILICYVRISSGKRAQKHHVPIHNFEMIVPRSKQAAKKEPYTITKRHNDVHRDSFAPLKRHQITKISVGKEHRVSDKSENDVKIPKHVIESGMQGNPFGHLSELLGLKGSFIPSQSRQRWMEDEEQSQKGPDQDTESEIPSASDSEIHSVPESDTRSGTDSEIRSVDQYRSNGLAKGTLPIDISPQQAQLITSTADSNSQRKKFIEWEKEGGSMDTRHFPSTFIKGETNRNAQITLDSDPSKRVSTQPNPDSLNSKVRTGAEFRDVQDGQPKQQVPNSQTSQPQNHVASETSSYSDLSAKENKKGFMGFASNPLAALDLAQAHGLSSELATGHSYLGNAMHSPNEQPLSHDMINKLQLDPAWDAMEAKILAQHGRRVMPMPLPVNKIEKEMLPPVGEPVGQAYLPDGQQAQITNGLADNFHKAAGFVMKPLRQDLESSSLYAHFQPSGQTEPHAMNVGGAMVHAIGDPWKNLKQTTYDHAEDNFPLASSSQQSSLVSAITGSATSSSAQVSDGGSESVGEPLVKVKGKKFTAKEGSKVNQPKNDDDNGSQGNLNVGKGKGNLKMNGNGRLNVLVKGKKFAKEKNNAGGDDEDDGQNRRKGKQQQKVLQNSNQREANNENEIIDVGPARITEREEENKLQDQNDDDNSKLQMVKVKGKQQRPLRTQTSEEEDDDQGPKFSKQESNNDKVGGRPQMFNGQQWHMEPGQHQQRFQNKGQGKAPSNAGKYITHKFVNFLSDVAKHLNVDKLSIAEQLVSDVEQSKKSAKQNLKNDEVNKAADDGLEKQIILGLPEKKRNIGRNSLLSNSSPVHFISSSSGTKADSVGALRIRRKQPTVLKYIWNKGISVLKEN